MRKKFKLLIVALACLFGSFLLYVLYVNYDCCHFLKYTFWIPIPVALFALLESKRIDP